MNIKKKHCWAQEVAMDLVLAQSVCALKQYYKIAPFNLIGTGTSPKVSAHFLLFSIDLPNDKKWLQLLKLSKLLKFFIWNGKHVNLEEQELKHTVNLKTEKLVGE